MAEILVHVRAADLAQVLGSEVLPKHQVRSIPVPADTAVVIGDDQETDVYLVKYNAEDPVKGETGFFGPCFGPWTKIGEAPSLKALTGSLQGTARYAVEDCRGIETFLPCGCVEYVSWAHKDFDFQQAVGCRTCVSGYRSNQYPVEVEPCKEHVSW